MTGAIVLCGCTGPVGRMLVSRLSPHTPLVLVGRDAERVAAAFPGHEAIDYGTLAQGVANARLVVNLTARNNNQSGSLAEFEAVNRDFAVELARRHGRAEGVRFIHLSTFHVLNPGQSHYARSKLAGERALLEDDAVNLLVLRVPAIQGEEASGNLARLARLPVALARPSLTIARALRPTLSADRLARFLLEDAADWPDRVTELADDQGANPVFGAVQRAIDVLFALAVISLLSWLALLVWLAIQVESKGPGIFRQIRVGQHGRPFVCYKFRTMAVGTPQSGTHEVSASAVTRVGKWLRKTKIDELPQVVNLLRNELSLVGPRPCLPSQQELITERSTRGVDVIKPGITGLAQINDIDMGTPRLLAQWDRRYAMMRAIPFDAKLILATFMGRGQGDRTKTALT